MLNSREKNILLSTVIDYIHSGNPVSSSRLNRNYNVNVSSATIRNVMSRLEELGYLKQPHVSAGRIPTDKGYRYYVDNSIFLHSLTEGEKGRIKSQLEKKIMKLDNLLQATSSMLSEVSKKIGVTVLPEVENDRLRCLKIIPISDRKVCALIITKSGIVREELFEFNEHKFTDRLFLKKVNNYLDELLQNKKLSRINEILENNSFENIDYNFLLKHLLGKLINIKNENKKVYIKGLINYLKTNNSKDLIYLFENGTINSIMDNIALGRKKIMIKIGNENNNEILNNYSIISKLVDIDDNLSIKIGILGEKRFNYGKIISLLEYTGILLEEKFKKEG